MTTHSHQFLQEEIPGIPEALGTLVTQDREVEIQEILEIHELQEIRGTLAAGEALPQELRVGWPQWILMVAAPLAPILLTRPGDPTLAILAARLVDILPDEADPLQDMDHHAPAVHPTACRRQVEATQCQ